MAKGNPHPCSGTKNLKPVRTKAEAKKRGRAGGIKSGIARREKKLMSQIYNEFLAKKYGEKYGDEIVRDVMKDIIEGRDGPSVSLIKEIREATEGNKIKIEIPNADKIDDDLNKIAQQKLKEINDKSGNA